MTPASTKPRSPRSVGSMIAIGVGVGTAIGVATGSIPSGVALGAGLGAALGYHLRKRDLHRRDGDQDC